MPPDVRSLERTRRGWYMYDWANSAFAVTILSALFGPYLDKVVVPPGGVSIPFLDVHGLTATSLYGYTLGISALIVLLTSPVLGAIADLTSARRKFLMFFCALGSLASMLLFFIGPGDIIPALALFFVANVSFVSGNVFYDSFLPHIASPEEQDHVSGKGYAYGYAGGGILFVLQLLLIEYGPKAGLVDDVLAVRIALASAGAWWGGFSLVTFARLHEPATGSRRAPVRELVAFGFHRIAGTMRRIRRLRHMGVFLLAFMVYNDGIQTVIALSTMYGSEELHFDTTTLMGCLLMVQAVGFIGSQLFAVIARRLGTRRAVILSLVIWSAIVLYAFYMTRPIEFWILGALAGLVLGGSQALSRSLYGKMIPVSASAEFFGFFSVFEKFSAIWGPIVFAAIRQITGSSRLSILSLLGFFLTGIIGMLFFNDRKAAAEGQMLESQLDG